MATATLSKKQWPFAPQAVNNCLLWLDAADQSSYTPGASVSTWRNKGYSGGNATTTSGTVGSTTADINGLPAMSFATNAYMTAPSMAYTQTTRTAFVVVNIGASGTVRRFMCSTGTNSIDSYIITAGTDLEFNYNGNNNYITASPYPIFNTTSIMCGTTLSTNGGIFVNGLAQTPYSTNNPLAYGTGSTTTQTIGFSSSGAFVLGEAMIFDGAITDIQRQQVEGYLATKWGLQSYLPTTHPYFTLNNLITNAFEPTQIPTCALWLDASDATSITGTSVVYQWKDKSGNGYNATATSGNPTLTQNALNGKSVLTFGGSAYMTSPLSMSTTGPLTYFCVAKPAAAGFIAVSAINGGGANNRPNTLMMYDAGSSPNYWWFSGGTGAVDGNTVTLATSTSRYDINANYWSPNYTQMNINGVSYASSTNAPASLASGGTFLVASASGLYEFWNGTIAEIIVYNSTLTTAQRQAVESYLGNKWNIPIAGQGSVAPVANPLAISGCQLWLDAADATTIVLNGGIVSTWRDNSGLGNNMSLTAGAVTYVSNPGPPCVNFASGGILQTTNYISIASGVSFIFIVCQATAMSGGGFDYVIGCTDINGGDTSIRFYPNILSIGNGDSNDLGNSTGYYVNGVLSTSNPVAVPTGYNMIGVLVNRSGTTRFSLSTSFGSRFFIGNIREVIVYTGPITTTQRLQVENYLMAKWGTGRNFWIDASDATTVTKGTTVTKWLDKSGNGNTATTLGSTVTSSAAGLAFNGSAYMSVPGIAGTIVNTPFVIFIVETLSDGNNSLYFGDDNVNNGGAYGYSLHTGYRSTTNQTFAMYGSDLEDTTVSGTGSKRIWALYLPTASNRNTRRNGTVDVTFSNYNRLLAFTAPVVGRSLGGGYYTGTISEIIVYNQDIGLTAIQQIETYLGNKWGVTVATSVPGITNPASIAGCKLWLDSADPAALVTAVSQMTDKSGNGYTITQSTAGYQPTLTNNYLTLGTSLNSYMNMPQAAINNTTSWTLFLVFNPSSSTNWIMAKQFDGTNSYNMLSMTNYTNTGGGNTTGTTGVLYFRPYNAGTLFTGPAALTTSSNQLLTMICNGTNIYYYVNGVLSAITNGTFTIQSQTGATNATLGAWISSSALTNSGVTNFQLGELSFYNSALTTIQTQEIAASLMNKWSITNTVQTATGSLADTPFFPTDIAGCLQWLDGADTSNITMTGTAITTWKDKSGNGYNATGVNSPAYVISTGGVSFNSASTQYFTMSVPYSKTNTMFMVASPPPSTTSNVYYTNTSAGNAGANFIGGYSSSYIVYYIGTNSVQQTSFVSTLPTTPFVVATVKTSGVSSVGYYNGAQVFSIADNTSDTASTWAWLGGAGIVGGTFYNALTATIYEFIIYNVALSTAQIAQVNKYLQNKWNTASTVITIPTPVYNRVFQPVDIPGCLLWLDAADTSSNSITFSSGTTVSAWLDKSGNGNNGTANTGVAWAANGMGTNLPAMTFTNSQWFLGNISITGSTMTVFGVISMSASSPFAARMIALAATNANDYNNPAYVGILRQSSNNMGPYRNGNYPSVTFSYNTPTLLSTWYDGTNANISANGALTPSSSASSGNFTVSSYAVAANTNLGDISAASFYGYMSELIVYNFSLSTSQRQQVEAYLSWKWNLRSSLPSTHPGYTLPSFSAIFTPKSISGLQMWLDGADPNATGVAPANGTTVSVWYDKSGNGYNATVASGKIAGTYSTANKAIYCTASNTGYVTSYTAAPSLETMFVVFNNPSPSGNNNMVIGGPQGARSLSGGYAGGGAGVGAVSYLNNEIAWAGMASMPASTYTSGSTVIITGQVNGLTTSISQNGGTIYSATQTTTSFTAGTTTYLGTDYYSSNYYYIGYEMEVIFYNSLLSLSQRQQVEGYLAWKWGLASSLPSTHPFKKFSP
jgi:hypothetical protein